MDKDKEISGLNNLEFKIIVQGILVGIIVGIVIMIYKTIIGFGMEGSNKVYSYTRENPKLIIPLFLVLIFLGFIVGIIVKKNPMIGGSGIPQVEGELSGKISVNWLRVFRDKFIGGIICMASGLSLGKEGPSVQIGASIGEGFAKIFKRSDFEKRLLITGGASSGLAVIFNAPLSGAIFALEEVHRSFSLPVMLAALSASLTGVFVDNLILGNDFCIKIPPTNSLPIQYYWTLLILGAILGVTGWIFNKGLLKTQDFYVKTLKKIPIQFKTIIPFVMVGILALTIPEAIDGGDSLIESVIGNNIAIKLLIVILVIKFIFTFFSYSSGVPGGIFFPLLAIGALVGAIFGLLLNKYLGISDSLIVNFIVLAMAAQFASIVKAPITGLMLITEMTGTFKHLLPVAITVTVAYLVSDMLNNKPIYESLLEKLLERMNIKFNTGVKKKEIFDFEVKIGSELDGKLIKDVKWPEGSLIITIFRGAEEIIPNGEVKIQSGDVLEVIFSKEKQAQYYDEISKKIYCEI
ncbi:ClC family H(+)/Cl(-) exchange transporter [Clostridium perfringens]|uniref:ClC family H(+)/Cl(-) exchange transporter n=1 Tax=Clostridium perfringens TaxID=1502 RepID=UPI002AC3FA3E|nr:chloride channel protein [Clostridium perfringens]MDZ5044606.1 ClC family H(+)/Cl(-) exchange transporter [Clostridium perfringens]MDZ5050275.1 ClC family H(+)/Cl(-) exchange transporter [Clostridium perfringens]MDZ5059299.1 ClC family H(+)/Cl(-) exchange transporter [Clostridium perfringens]MDZ5070030.1 ClC family H(+)/Cl(-) exchange transporter [Clostridium perfringens]MDZ5089350.1 ClC family H(+)/Cl(-) exchange transporter [Clostridium perfringens]